MKSVFFVKRHTTAVWLAVFLGGACPPACTDSEKGKTASVTVVAAGQSSQASQQKPQEQEKDADEEGAPNPVTATAEKPAPQQPSGRQLIYNFDRDSVGQLPAKFHSARTGQGSATTGAVITDPPAPSKPNVV